MPFTTTMTTTTLLDNSLVLLFSDLVYFAAQPELVAEQFATTREDIGGKSIDFSKYSGESTDNTTPLTETDDPASFALADTAVTLTPVEQGGVITKTKLASLQTGGKADIACAKAVGFNLGRTMDKLAMNVLEAAAPVATIYPNSATATSNLATTDVCDRVFANRLYNKLARRNTPPIVNGLYAAIAHDDVLYDLRDSLQDISKFGIPDAVSRNAVGVAFGFVWYRSSNVTVTADTNGTIDAYNVLGFGDNVLAKATSLPVGIHLSGPFDKLGRFLNIGWYGVVKYGILDGNNMVIGKCASSVGSNS